MSLLRRSLLAACAALVAVGAAPGQIALGHPLALPAELARHAVAAGERAAAKLWCCYATPASARYLAWDGPAIASAAAGAAVAVVAVVAPAADGSAGPLPAGWRDATVATLSAAAAEAWLGDERGQRWYLVLTDADGVVRFLGAPGAGLEDAIAGLTTPATVAGLDAERDAFGLRRLQGFDSAALAAARKELAAAAAARPRDGRLAGLRVAYAAHVGDDDGAVAVAREALLALAEQPRPLAVLADLALRSAVAPRFAAEYAERLAPLVAAAPEDLPLGMAALRAFLVAGRDRDVGRQAMRLRKAAFADAASALAYGEVLTHAARPEVHLDLVAAALARGTELGGDERELAALRYAFELRCRGDRKAARAVRDDYLERLPLRVSCNNDCWYFLTEFATMGRFDAFAAALAERMLEEEAAMDYFEFDTAAFAMFRAGRVDEAIALQRKAIAKAGREDPDYRRRLQRYEATARAAK